LVLVLLVWMIDGVLVVVNPSLMLNSCAGWIVVVLLAVIAHSDV
jgi:hypothetical protein